MLQTQIKRNESLHFLIYLSFAKKKNVDRHYKINKFINQSIKEVNREAFQLEIHFGKFIQSRR